MYISKSRTEPGFEEVLKEELVVDLMQTNGTDQLKNSLVFTWAFVEMLVWFWVSDDGHPALRARDWVQRRHQDDVLTYSGL